MSQLQVLQTNPNHSPATNRNSTPPTCPTKLRRRTKAEMEIFQAKKEQQKLRKEQERAMANLKKAQAKAQKASTQLTCSSCSQSWAKSQSQKQLEEFKDWGKLFVEEDYQNMITYLEDSHNYTALFGDSAKTLVGVKQMTKLQAFEVFTTWLNVQNLKLLLNGR
jgi:Zn-dependent M32 family carboxypeptidase